MQSLLRDIRFGARVLRKNSAFTIAAVLTLALGIGANTAIFTVTNALLLRPFPYREPERLVIVGAKDQNKEFGGTLLRYEMLRDHSQSFEGVAAFTTDNFNLTGRGEPVQVPIARASANFFSLLGVQPELGRTFTEDEGRPEGKPVVMLSDALWRSRFNGDRNVIGQTVTLDTTPHTIVGVLPANVQFPFVGEADIWTPRYFEYSIMSTQRLRMGVGYLGLLARMRPGTTVSSADAELAVLNRQYRQENPNAPDADPKIEMTAEPLRELVVADVRGKVLMLSAAVALVLLIACANVTSLLLSRALVRKKGNRRADSAGSKPEQRGASTADGKHAGGGHCGSAGSGAELAGDSCAGSLGSGAAAAGNAHRHRWQGTAFYSWGFAGDRHRFWDAAGDTAFANGFAIDTAR